MDSETIAVFGGTGFLGRRVVQALLDSGCSVRVAARRPNAIDLPAGVEAVQADITNEQQVREAVCGTSAVVNAVSLYVEKGAATFQRIHVEAAGKLARVARESGVQQLVHVSGLGVDKASPSRFVAARAQGEEAVSAAYPNAVLVRPSVMFGCDDAFLSSLDQVTRLPVIPLFGNGQMRLQPAWVDDVGQAIARLARDTDRHQVYEFGGGKAYTYREAVEAVKQFAGRRGVVIPVHFGVWRAMVAAMGVLPKPPLTRDQLILMMDDNVPTGQQPGFAALEIEPRALEQLFQECLT